MPDLRKVKWYYSHPDGTEEGASRARIHRSTVSHNRPFDEARPAPMVQPIRKVDPRLANTSRVQGLATILHAGVRETGLGGERGTALKVAESDRTCLRAPVRDTGESWDV